MSNYNQLYFSSMKTFVEDNEKAWRNKEMSNKQALDFFKEKNGEIFFFVRNNPESEIRNSFLKLGIYVQDLIKEIREEIKTIYVIKTNNKLISVSDETLLQKCLLRLGNNVDVFKMKVCQNEEDLDYILDNNQSCEQEKNKSVQFYYD